MKKPTKFFRKSAALCLAFCMILAMFPAAFADEIPWDQLTPEQVMMLQAQLEEEERIRKEKEKKRLEELAAQAAAAAAAEQAAAEEAARLAAEEAARIAAEEAAKQAEELLDAPAAELPAENAVDEPTAAPVEEIAEEPVDEVAEEPVDEVAEEPADELADEPVDEPVSEPAAAPVDEIADEPVDETADEPVDETAEEPVDEAADEPADEVADEPADEAADEPADETTEEPVDETTEEPADEAADEPADEVADEAAEEPADEPVDEVADESTEEPVSTLALDNGEVSVPAVENNAEDENAVNEADEHDVSAPAAPIVSGIWKAAGQFFKTVQEAIDAIFNADPAATEAKVELTENYEGSESIDVEVEAGKNVIIDLCKKTFSIISGIAAKITGQGSVTIENGTIASGDGTAVQTDAADLDIKNATLVGDGSAAPVLDINGGDVDISGRTTIDSGKAANTAVDISGTSDVDIDTTGIVLGKVNASGANVDASLHNGFYNGEIAADADAKLAVDGGNYTANVGKYVGAGINYAEISNPAGKIYSAGKNIPWTAFGSSMFAPTFVNMLKSGGAVALPAGIGAANSTGKLIFINGRPVLNGQSIFIPGCRYACTAAVVDGANSVWYKGCKDGLTLELSSAVSYVTIDNVKVDAAIDGVYAELDADILEALTAGNHSVKFVLKNGSIAVTNLKIVPDEKVEWTKGSENGLEYEMSGKVKKVLIDHVKISAEIDGKNVSVPASVLQDLKTGKHTVEFVLENTSHVVTGITIK